mgnify:CR=1 FL=1
MSLNVLVVDDSSVTRKILRRTLGQTGLDLGNVLEAEDGACALDVLAKDPIDVVIADVNMPNVDGIELVTRMRASPTLKAIPVVVVTSNRSAQVTERLEQLGITAFLTKPFRPELFASAIRDLLPTKGA